MISVANVLHVENPLAVEDDWIEVYGLEEGNVDVTAVDPEVEGIIRIYNDEICDVLDNYNCSAYYEPSYVIAGAYQNGGF